MLLIATIIHQRANEPSTFTASSQSHKSALIAAPLWNKLPATFRSALMPGTISLIPCVCYPSLTIIVQVPREWLGVASHIPPTTVSGTFRAIHWRNASAHIIPKRVTTRLEK